MKVKIGPFRRSDSRRKIDVKIDKFDTWNLDNTLAYIIYPALLQLKETKHGIPSYFSTIGGEGYDEQESFDFYKEDHNELFEQRIKEWEEILDKMIWSFQQLIIDDYSTKYHHGDPKFDFVESEQPFPNPISGKLEKTYKMVDKNPNSHWYDAEGHALHEERIQEGLELFGKYYRALWD